MTIDEAIARERQQAKEQRNHIGTWDDEYSKKCEVYAEEHEQLAEWLEELKAYRTLDKTNFSDGYNKAIDDFAENLKIKAHKKISLQLFLDESDLVDEDQIREMIDEIAEQLKAGGAE